jgi:hypothetical protein
MKKISYYRNILKVLLGEKAVCVIIASLFFSTSLRAQIFSSSQNISGTINTYTAVTAVSTCSVTVASTSGFVAGNKVLLIQMQGATIDLTNTSAFGSITAINNTGNYEFGTINNVSGSVVILNSAVLKSYTVASKVQLITVPQYNGGVSITGALTATTWSGTTGGVLVFEASTVSMSANIDVSGQGFRAGNLATDGNDCYGKGYYSGPKTTGADTSSAKKGEGIHIEAGTSYAYGRGAPANAGGGGNEHNGGGGGGANYGAGGIGGLGLNLCNATNALIAQGIGGYSLSGFYSNANNKVMMGGGAGDGGANNTQNTLGTRGGGIVMIKATSITSGGNSILANGVDNTGVSLSDGSGGAGAGGAVLLNVGSYPSAITIEAKGGKGSDNSYAGNDCYAPGGGGGGGVVWLSQTSTPGGVSVNVSGGLAGIITVLTGKTCYGSDPNYGAVAGSDGTTLFSLSMPENLSGSCTLPIELLFFKAELISENHVNLKWASAWEKDNSYYEIERSKDFLQWESLAVVPGKTNSHDMVQYSKSDNRPYYGTSYYRLKQVDIDGKVKYFNIESITIQTSSFGIVEVYPNPADQYSKFTIKYLSDYNENVAISFIDMLGRTVYAKNYIVSESYNKLELDISMLAKGCYILNVKSESGNYITRVIVK